MMNTKPLYEECYLPCGDHEKELVAYSSLSDWQKRHMSFNISHILINCGFCRERTRMLLDMRVAQIAEKEKNYKPRWGRIKYWWEYKGKKNPDCNGLAHTKLNFCCERTQLRRWIYSYIDMSGYDIHKIDSNEIESIIESIITQGKSSYGIDYEDQDTTTIVDAFDYYFNYDSLTQVIEVVNICLTEGGGR